MFLIYFIYLLDWIVVMELNYPVRMSFWEFGGFVFGVG